jgi:hypothetical protein
MSIGRLAEEINKFLESASGAKLIEEAPSIKTPE